MRYPMRGFTLVEFVIVVILVGILAATVMISFNAGRQHSVVVRADEFRRAISHAQLTALSQGARLRLTTTASGYSVCDTATCPAILTDPTTGGPFSADFSGENVILSAAPIAAIDFDSMGRPQSGGALLATTTTFTFTGGGNSVSVRVFPITGFAQAS